MSAQALVQECSRHVSGHVKWFDMAKRFGFIVSDTGGPDILLHANVLRNFGVSSVVEDSKIEVIVQETARGPQAYEVCSITPPVDQLEAKAEAFEVVENDGAELLPARVKWFCPRKDYGFANAFGDNRDIFIAGATLRKFGLAGAEVGEAVAVRPVYGEKGAFASEIRPWATT